MTNQVTVNQHYVPKFLLNRFGFGSEGNQKINIYDIEKEQVRHNQSIKKNFSQNFFYDIDNTIENFLEKLIETPASNAISKLINRDLSPILKPKLDNNSIIKFICCQLSRTVQAREDALAFVNEHFKQIVSTHFRLKDIEADANLYKLLPKGKEGMRNLMARVVLGGIIDSKAMEDLNFHLLINTTDREFIITDHPVVRYNLFYQDLDDPRMSSLTAKGLQLFLPLSPTLYLCAYDSTVYKYGSQKSLTTDVQKVSDVDYLNELQIRGALSYVAFHSGHMESYVEAFAKKYGGSGIYKRSSAPVSDEPVDDTHVKSTFMVFTTQKRVKKGLTFVKVLKKSRPSSVSFQERDPDVSAALMLLKRHARAKRRRSVA